MRLPASMGLVAIAVVAACDGEGVCVVPPCALPTALAITLKSSATGAPITTATLAVNGAVVTTFPCEGTCRVQGSAGSYVIQISALGFTTAYRTYQVTGTTPKCGCSTVDLQTVTISLDPAGG